MKIAYIIECVVSSVKETYWNKKFISPFEVHNRYKTHGEEQLQEDLKEYWSREYH